MIIKKYILLIAFSIIILCWVVIVFNVFVSSLPFNTIGMEAKNKKKILSILPEGFGYFTKNPRDEDVFVFKIYNKKLYNKVIKNSSYENLFGLSRISRAQGLEIANIESLIDERQWLSIDKSIYSLDFDTISSITIENSSVLKSICGEIIIQKVEPIPWAWFKSSLTKKVIMPSKMIKLSVKC